MFDIGWSEMAIIMLLALIIIGPKDLPRVARTIGQWVRKGRMLAREFQTSLEDMAKETELDDVRKEIEKVGRTDLKKTIENAIDPNKELTKAFDTSEPPSSKKDGEPAKTTNGHADGGSDKAASSDASSKPAAVKTEPKAAKAEATKAEPAKPKSPRKPAARTKKPATAPKKTTAKTGAAAKKPAAPRRKSSASASSSSKPASGADTSSKDEGGGAAMAAKSS